MSIIPVSCTHEEESVDEWVPHEVECRKCPKDMAAVVEINTSEDVGTDVSGREEGVEEEEKANLEVVLDGGRKRGDKRRTGLELGRLLDGYWQRWSPISSPSISRPLRHGEALGPGCCGGWEEWSDRRPDFSDFVCAMHFLHSQLVI